MSTPAGDETGGSGETRPQPCPPAGPVAAAASQRDKVDDELAALIQTLGDRTPGARQKAEQALSQFGERGIAALIGATGHEDYDIQFGAMSALARLGAPAVEPLIRALGDKDPGHWRVPINAATVLGRLGDARAVAPLVRAMGFGVNVEEAAANALADMGEFDVLVRALDSEVDGVAEHATLALSRLGDPGAADFIANRHQRAGLWIPFRSGHALADFGDPRAVGPLMRAYHGHYLGDAGVSYAVQIRVVELLAEVSSPEAVEPLIEILKDARSGKDSYGRGADEARSLCASAAQALGALNDARAVQPLIDVLGWDWRVDAAVARALGRLGAVEAIEPLTKAAYYPNDKARAAAGWALAVLRDARGTERLLSDLNDDRYALQAAASLVDLRDVRGEEALLRILEREESEQRDEAVLVLARSGNRRGLEELLRVLPRIMGKGGRDDWQKFQAVQILGDSGDERAVGPLLALSWWKIMPAVFRALGRLGDARCVDALARGLASDREKGRLAAAMALGRLGDERAVDPLILALDDIDGDVRASAARALAALGDMRALDPLVRLLVGKCRRVRLAAIDALCQLGNPAAIEPLTDLLSDADPAVSARAAEAVKLLEARDPARLQARAAELPEDQDYDLLTLSEGGFVRVMGAGQTITEILARVDNLVGREFRVVISPGTYFRASGSHQNMVARRECRFMLPASGSESMAIPATCINASLPIPSERDGFSGVARVPGDVARFLEAAQDAGPMAVQAGVWALTDGYSAHQVQMRLIRRDQLGNTMHAVSDDDIGTARRILDGLGIRHSL
jgi:HEAT repeat protein